MESNTKIIAKRARVEPRTQMHMTMKIVLDYVCLEKIVVNCNNKCKLCIGALERANTIEK